MGGSIGFFSLGPCRYLSSTACYIGYSFTLHCYSHSLWSILISFVFRYRILVTKMPSFSSLLTVVLLAYSVSLFQLVVCILAESPTEDIIALLQQTRPDYDLSGKTISGNLNIFGWKELFTNLHMSLPIVPVYIVIIILSVVIIRHLRTTAMSEQTKAMHSQLFKVTVSVSLTLISPGSSCSSLPPSLLPGHNHGLRPGTSRCTELGLSRVRHDAICWPTTSDQPYLHPLLCHPL